MLRAGPRGRAGHGCSVFSSRARCMPLSPTGIVYCFACDVVKRQMSDASPVRVRLRVSSCLLAPFCPSGLGAPARLPSTALLTASRQPSRPPLPSQNSTSTPLSWLLVLQATPRHAPSWMSEGRAIRICPAPPRYTHCPSSIRITHPLSAWPASPDPLWLAESRTPDTERPTESLAPCASTLAHFTFLKCTAHRPSPPVTARYCIFLFPCLFVCSCRHC